MILHVDMDAFYASVEQRDAPELRGKPVIVGGSPNGRGVVSAASYEARKFGVRSAMPTSQAARLCPDGVFVGTRMARYVEVSKQIRAIFDRYTPLVEPLSIDEAFLDVEPCAQLFGSAEKIGRAIKDAIRDELDLVASVGVAGNKFLAKLASDLEKPDGFTVIADDKVMEILAPLSVTRLWGVGKVTLARFEKVKLFRFSDLHALSVEQAQHLLGDRAGQHFWRLAHGIDSRSVTTDGEAKTVSHETTFSRDVSDYDALHTRLLELTDQVSQRLRRMEKLGKTVTIKIRYSDFRTISRSRSLEYPSCATDEIWGIVSDLFQQAMPPRTAGAKMPSLRLIGVGVSNLSDSKPIQLGLFDSEVPDNKIDAATDAIRKQFGTKSLKRGSTVRGVPRPRDG